MAAFLPAGHDPGRYQGVAGNTFLGWLTDWGAHTKGIPREKEKRRQ